MLSEWPNSSVPLRVLWTYVATALIAAGTLADAQSEPTEYQVKAAYLYNFGKFVTWPSTTEASTAESFGVCVLGDDPFGPALDEVVTNAMVANKKIIAKRMKDPAEASGCQIVFVASSESSRLDKVLRVLSKHDVLTVSDIPHFVDRRGMIQFVMDKGRVRFEVNLTATDDAGLVISSEMLKVAYSVKRIGQSGAHR